MGTAGCGSSLQCCKSLDLPVTDAQHCPQLSIISECLSKVVSGICIDASTLSRCTHHIEALALFTKSSCRIAFPWIADFSSVRNSGLLADQGFGEPMTYSQGGHLTTICGGACCFTLSSSGIRPPASSSTWLTSHRLGHHPGSVYAFQVLRVANPSARRLHLTTIADGVIWSALASN